MCDRLIAWILERSASVIISSGFCRRPIRTCGAVVRRLSVGVVNGWFHNRIAHIVCRSIVPVHKFLSSARNALVYFFKYGTFLAGVSHSVKGNEMPSKTPYSFPLQWPNDCLRPARRGDPKRGLLRVPPLEVFESLTNDHRIRFPGIGFLTRGFTASFYKRHKFSGCWPLPCRLRDETFNHRQVNPRPADSKSFGVESKFGLRECLFSESDLVDNSVCSIELLINSIQRFQITQTPNRGRQDLLGLLLARFAVRI